MFMGKGIECVPWDKHLGYPVGNVSHLQIINDGVSDFMSRVNKYMDTFYVAWRKAIRFLLNLPYTTHCNMLHYICSDIPVREQLYTRFCRFFHCLNNSDNSITKLCASVALHGSGSCVSNNISMVCAYQGISRFDISADFKYNVVINDQDTVASQVVIDLMNYKYLHMYNTNITGFTRIVCDQLIEFLCIS